MLIDTHVHLNHQKLYQKINQIINNAQNVGVEKFIVVGYDLVTSKQAIKIANQFSNCYASIGFHPTEVKTYTDEHYQWLEENATNQSVIAIGEVGYDFHWETTTKEEQENAFIRQINIAKKAKRPLIIHSRDAISLTYNTLKKYADPKLGGVMHSYSGSAEMAQEFIKIGFYLGISGPVTFINGKSMKEVVKTIDLKYLLSETDSPYLTPHPFRGQENSPQNIPLIIEAIARIKGISTNDVEQQLEKNVYKLFGV